VAKKTAKRHYSREFEQRGEHSKALTVSRVPPGLLRAFRARVKAERLSQRAVVLNWIQNWTEGRRPDEGARA
jgi:hypothetical protein